MGFVDSIIYFPLSLGGEVEKRESIYPILRNISRSTNSL